MAKSIARNLADVASPTGVLDGTLSTAAQTNITSVGTLSSLTISGNLNATLTTAAQTNITSLGTLSSLNLSGALTGTTGTFTTADNLTQVRLISTDADASIGPRLDLFRNSASPAAGDFTGRIRFLAEDSAGNETAYVHFDSLIVDPTDGSEDGQLRIETKTNGTMQNRIEIDSGETVINEDSIDADFRVESNDNANMFKVDAGNNQVIVGIGTAFTDTAYGFYARNGAIVGNYSGAGNGLAVYRGAALQTRITHDSTRGFVSTGGNPLHFRTALSGSDFKLSIGTSDVVINENGGDVDFRVESDSKTHMLYVDAGNNRVGINTSSPDHILHVEDNTVDGEVSPKIVNTNSGSSAFAGLSLHGEGNNFKIKNWGDGTSNANATEFNSTAGSSHFIFSPGNSEAMRINNDGTVDFTSHIDLPDSKYVRLGNNADMIIYHDGTSNYVQAVKQDSDIIFRGNDGGTSINAMYLDMSAGGVGRMLNGLRPQTDGVGNLGSSTLRWGQLHVKSTQHEGIKFTVENTTANAARTGIRVDMDVSGSDTLTGDRAQYGHYVTLDSSATGGDTSNEHRLYGLRSSTKATGDSDLIYGGYFSGEAEHSAGTVSALYGSYSQASADPESGGTISNLYGTWNTATVYGSSGSTVQNAYASYNRMLLGATDVIAHNTIHGVMSEIETDPSGTARVTANGYLFRGLFDDDSAQEHKFTNFYGLHIAGTSLVGRTELETDNTEPRFGLPTGSTAGVYLDIPMESDYNCQGFWNSEDQPNYFRGSLGIGSGARQVGNTAGMELHLVEPQGGDMLLARYDSATTTNEVLGRIFFGCSENAGVNVNYNTSIESYAGGPQSTSDSEGYLVFKTTANSSTTLTERMRIQSNGKVGIGTTQPGGRFMIEADGSSEDILVINNTRSGSNSTAIQQFKREGTNTGFIANTSSATSYATSQSDRRAKKNFEDWTENVLPYFKDLKPTKFHFTQEDDSGEKNKGYIAQDLVGSFPEAYPLKDSGEDADRYFFNPSGMVVYLMKAIQEQQTQIEALQAEVAALKGS